MKRTILILVASSALAFFAMFRDDISAFLCNAVVMVDHRGLPLSGKLQCYECGSEVKIDRKGAWCERCQKYTHESKSVP